MAVTIKTNVSRDTDVLIGDLGYVIPKQGGSVVVPTKPMLLALAASGDLEALATDDAYGAGSSTLILNDGVVDVDQDEVSSFIRNVAVCTASCCSRSVILWPSGTPQDGDALVWDDLAGELKWGP